jgi:RNA 2',3'-cyclic 3'-phosphodiesterase
MQSLPELVPAQSTRAAADLIEPPMTMDRPRRVFIGLKITPEIAQELAKMALSLKGDSVRLVAGSDIHLTLVPPWNESGVTEAAEKLRKAVCCFGCFVLTFEHLRYGPTPRHPHLLWAECVASEELIALRAALLAAFGQTEARPFRPHVTLARIPNNGRVIARKNPLDQSLSFTQHVRSVELFQSPPKGSGGYQVLASLPLKREPRSADLASGGGLPERD